MFGCDNKYNGRGALIKESQQISPISEAVIGVEIVDY